MTAPRECRPAMLSATDVLIFIKAEGHYAVQTAEGVSFMQQAADHAILNPGTLRVEDKEGGILWQLQ